MPVTFSFHDLRMHAADSARPFKVSGDPCHSITGVTAARISPRRIHAVAKQCGSYRKGVLHEHAF
jgi:hypothetical protein